ncbi:MAG: PQQ-binding-like beta-propeller repeat protein [Mariprofundaceae bacterium]|nr:PQQ-binding-like beta-propeller repeat protein [Mariprofundaceae bacterium]
MRVNGFTLLYSLVAGLLFASLPLSQVAVASGANTNIEVLWSVDVDQRRPNSPAAYSAPTLVHTDKQTFIVIGGRDRWVHIYSLDGWEERRVALQGPVDSGALALSNGWVVLADTAGRLYAIDPVQGNIVWKRQLTATFSGSPIAIGDDFLIQTTDNRLYRFSAQGEKRWSFSGQGSVLSMYLNPSPLVVGHEVYALFNNGDAIALKAISGDLLWKRQLLLNSESIVLSELKAPLATPIFMPALHIAGEQSENVLLMSFFQGEILALNTQDGVQQLNLPISIKSAPIHVENTMFMADSHGFLYAYDIVQGTQLWKKRISNTELTGPILWKNALWLTDNQGTVFRLNQAGEVQATLNLEGSINRLPLTTPEGLLIRTDRGALYMIQ